MALTPLQTIALRKQIKNLMREIQDPSDPEHPAAFGKLMWLALATEAQVINKLNEFIAEYIADKLEEIEGHNAAAAQAQADIDEVTE